MKKETEEEYVFIVGLPRTGTKLVRNILHRSTDPCCVISPETWFFGDLFRRGIKDKMKSIGSMHRDENLKLLVDYMCSNKFQRTYCNILFKKEMNITQKQLFEVLSQSDRSDKGIYRALMNITAKYYHKKVGNVILGDKTPGHLYYVNTLLKWFPKAKIIHTFRDPRAIAASECRRIVDSDGGNKIFLLGRHINYMVVIVYVIFTWMYAAYLNRRFKRIYPSRYYLSKYEDVVLSPEKSIPGLCEFLGFTFNDSMLEPDKVNSSFIKHRGMGIDQSCVSRWKKHLSPSVRKIIEIVCGRQLKKFGYS